MSHEIRHNPGVSGRTYWAELYSEGKLVWDTSTNTFRDESLATAANRAIVMSDLGNSGKYWADLPEPPAGFGYQWFVRRQAGGSPSLTDAIELVGDAFNWTGLFVYSMSDAPTVGAIAAAVVAALAGSTLSIVSPVDATDGDRLTLIAGDDYTQGNRIPTWTITSYAGPTLGATGVVRLLPIADYNRKGSDADAVLEVDATVAVDGTTVTITAPIAYTDSDDLANVRPGEDDSHKYQIVVDTAAGKPNTLKLGPVTVTRRIEPQE